MALQLFLTNIEASNLIRALEDHSVKDGCRHIDRRMKNPADGANLEYIFTDPNKATRKVEIVCKCKKILDISSGKDETSNFNISDKELSNLRRKLNDHIRKKSCKNINLANSDPIERANLKYKFTNTGIGTKIDVTCSCGSEFDISDYESW